MRKLSLFLLLPLVAIAQVTITDKNGLTTYYPPGQYDFLVGGDPNEPPDPNIPPDPNTPPDPNEPPDPNVPPDPNEPPMPEPAMGLVYTTAPRHMTPIPGTDIEDGSSYQNFSDVGNIHTSITESDVVYKPHGGDEIVIYNCSTSEENCAAQEARSSPDGTKIAYTVSTGDFLAEQCVTGAGCTETTVWALNRIVSSAVWVYDIPTGTNTKIPLPEGIAHMGDWYNNNEIIVSATWNETYPPKSQGSLHRGYDQYGQARWNGAEYSVSEPMEYTTPSAYAQNIYRVNLDGSNIRNLTPHSPYAMAPTVLTDGSVCYSEWWAHGDKNFDKHEGTSIGTATNQWAVLCVDGNGSDIVARWKAHQTPNFNLGQYALPGQTGGENWTSTKAARGLAEFCDQKLGVLDYYRTNHLIGLGLIHVFSYSSARWVEGMLSNQYVPGDHYVFTPYGNNQDTSQKFDGEGRALGKPGYPSALPDCGIAITHGRGYCKLGIPEAIANSEALGGEPLCDMGIWQTHTDMINNPYDPQQMTPLVDRADRHEFNQDYVGPYADLYGQDMPDQTPPLTGDTCELHVVNAREGTFKPAAAAYDWLRKFEDCTFQGCAVSNENPDWFSENMAGLAIHKVGLWDVTYPDPRFNASSNNHGYEYLELLGVADLEDDGSIKVEVPCGEAYVMSGVTEQGYMIAQDLMAQSIPKGGSLTCYGCHKGHDEEFQSTLAEGMDTPVLQFAKTIAAGKEAQKLTGSERLNFMDDVLPIIESECTSCHVNATNSDGLLWSRLTQDREQMDVPWSEKKPGTAYTYGVYGVLIRDGGEGYAVNDELLFQNTEAKGFVEEISDTGAITAIRMTAEGPRVHGFSTVAVSTVDGFGAELYAMNGGYKLQRPYLSKLISRFSSDSLLMWMITNTRLDGRTDNQYANDIDKIIEHPTIAPEKAAIIARWIDAGVQRN